jgi:hypothetical protein
VPVVTAKSPDLLKVLKKSPNAGFPTVFLDVLLNIEEISLTIDISFFS